MAWLADTNILVYRHDSREPAKQARAKALLREGIAERAGRISYQAVIEFVSATSRPARGGGPALLARAEALREADELLNTFEVLYPTEALVRLAIRGAAAYELNWFDAQMWACAEHFGLPVLYSEDFQHDRQYGTVRVINPFLG